MTVANIMQAVPIAQMHSYSQLYPQQAVFALNEPAGRLYTAGGAAPSTVHTWDMSQERCTQQVGSGSPFLSVFMKQSTHSFIHSVIHLFVRAYTHAACSQVWVRIMHLQLHALVNVSHALVTFHIESLR